MWFLIYLIQVLIEDLIENRFEVSGGVEDLDLEERWPTILRWNHLKVARMMETIYKRAYKKKERNRERGFTRGGLKMLA